MAEAVKNILVVEDERPLRNALELKFQKFGLPVKTAENGKEALEILEKEKFDLIIMDLMMPEMDGFGLLEALKKKKIKTPVLVLTNLNQDEDRQKVSVLGAKGFFIKSDITVLEIVQKAQEFLSSS